jgi:hypothetical protein
MDEILADHKRGQLKQTRLIRIMAVVCILMALLLVGLGLVIYQQFHQGQLQETLLQQALDQGQALSDQGKKTDDVAKKLDQQPKISVQPPASSDPSGSPVVVIETPAAPDASASAPIERPTVKIPIKLPETGKKK